MQGPRQISVKYLEFKKKSKKIYIFYIVPPAGVQYIDLVLPPLPGAMLVRTRTAEAPTRRSRHLQELPAATVALAEVTEVAEYRATVNDEQGTNPRVVRGGGVIRLDRDSDEPTR